MWELASEECSFVSVNAQLTVGFELLVVVEVSEFLKD
jgi:hypothetical protein